MTNLSKKIEAMSEDDYQKLIVPIFQKMERQGEKKGLYTTSFVGNGFFVEDFFITAAHVIEEARCAYIKIGNEEKMLCRENAIIWRSMKQHPPEEYGNLKNGDIAVYRFDGVDSPLTLSETVPIPGDELVSCYYYSHTWHNTKGFVGDSEDWFCGNFFGWRTDANSIHPQEGGSSGSPLLKNGVVYGVLHAGNEKDPSICVFTTATFVKKLMLDYL